MVKKDPVTSIMLDDMVKDANNSSTLTDLTLTTASLLAYAEFLLFNELINIRLCDITRIHLPCSKMDQLRKGDEVASAQTRNVTCPVAMLERYMAKTGIAWDKERLLFRPICKTAKDRKIKTLRLH